MCHSKGGRLVLVKERIHCTACHKTHSAGTGKREEVEEEVEDDWKEKGDEDVQDTEGWWYTQGLVDAQLDGSRRQKAWLVGKVAATVDREGRTTRAGLSKAEFTAGPKLQIASVRGLCAASAQLVRKRSQSDTTGASVGGNTAAEHNNYTRSCNPSRPCKQRLISFLLFLLKKKRRFSDWSTRSH